MNVIKKMVLKNKRFTQIAISIRNYPREYKLYLNTKKKLNFCDRHNQKIFYLGAARHANLGDLAQSVCIRKWLKKHYKQEVIEIETNAIVNTRFSVLKKMKEVIAEDDIIVFQSGYTTTDLGGFADEMHRVIMESFPNNAMLMLPQTIFFKNKDNESRTSKCYNNKKNLLYLARDKVSYEKALKMFPDLTVKLYPDIVTTLIGTMKFNYSREGILFCCRNDEEKLYSDEEIAALKHRCEKITFIDQTDTTKCSNRKDIINHSEEFILNEIDKYAHYKLVVTDRYHGTILSLVAGTPVVILKTTDHKVVTGADWFKGVYDEYVNVSDNLEDAYSKILKSLNMQRSNFMTPYFEREYYDKLPGIFEKVREK